MASPEASFSASPEASFSEPLTVEDSAELVGFLLGSLAFIFLIGLDLRNAIKKGAHWVPGRALVLSALTIQIMNFVENQTGLLDEFLKGSGSLNNEKVKNNLFMIHISRVMLCVLVAFFLPGMARPGSQEKWTKIAAIGLTVFIDIFSELSSVHRRSGKSSLAWSPISSELISLHRRSDKSSVVSHFFYSWAQGKEEANQVSKVSFFVSGAIISITLIWLILLLICAAIASKSIRNITTQKIPIILAEPADNTWKGVEDQVLKSWIVARACYPESIIARSVLSSSAALGVTICILSSVVGWLVQGPKVKFHRNPEFCLKFIITILEVIFILIGWAIIGWRWLTSVAYYGRGRKEERRPYFRLEDYWTRHIVDLQEAENLKLRELKVDERISKMFVTKLRKLKVDERVSKMIAKEKKRKTSLVWISLECALLLQRYVVFFSKLCWFFSDLVFGNKFIRKVMSVIFSGHFKEVNKEFEEYKEILNNMDNILWDQTIRDMILTNRKCIKQAKGIMMKGSKDGENCHALIPFLRDGSSGTCVGIQYLDPEKAHAQTGLKFLWRHYPVNPLKVEKYFNYASKRSWKLTAVSLINIIVRLSPLCSRDSFQAYYGRDCLQAYYEAWELIDLVDESDPETDGLLSKAADRLFTAIREQSEKQQQQQRSTPKGKAAAAATVNDPAAAAAAAAATVNDPAAAATMNDPVAAIKGLADESEKAANDIYGKIDNGEDTMEDWENLAAKNALYKLCMSIDCPSRNLNNLMDELRSSLRDIIGSCIENVGRAIVDSCRKWAQDLDKVKLLEAVYIAGKSKGLMETLGRDPNLQIARKTHQHGWCENVRNAPATEGSSMV